MFRGENVVLPAYPGGRRRWTAAVLCLAAAVLLSACGTGEKAHPDSSVPETPPSLVRIDQPEQEASPEQVMTAFFDCLRVGDSETLCSLFADSSPEAVAEEARYAFRGPLAVWGTTVERWDRDNREVASSVPPDPALPVWLYVTFHAYDRAGEFQLTVPGELELCYFPELRHTDAGWRIVTLGNSSPPDGSLTAPPAGITDGQ